MLIIFVVLASVCITCGTIFVVREIEIVDATVPAAEVLSETEKNEIINKSGLMGKNILFNLNEEKISQGVKSVNPSLKVQSVRAEFPNRVVLEVSRRVPVFYDSKSQLYFDAEMCVVDSQSADCIDIADANLDLAGKYKVGDMVVGDDETEQCKVSQLKTIVAYFPSVEGFEIAYKDDPADVGAYLVCLVLKINHAVTFEIKIEPKDDFLRALEFANQIYQDWNFSGEYQVSYDDRNKVEIIIGDKEYHEE